MNKTITVSIIAGLFAVLAARTHADSVAYGVRLSQLNWQEKSLYEERIKEDGLMFGPTLRFNFGRQEQYVAGLDVGYAAMGDLDRADFDLLFGYNISPAIRLFADLRYLWQDLDQDASDTLDRDIKTTALGVGVGIEGSVPLGYSGFFVFGSMRVAPMRVKTDIDDADGTAVSWSYEAGVAYAWVLDTIAADSSVFIAAGYRHQQMKGGEFDERAQTPFAEFGFRQEF